jgi:tetratricopeptide (TPR) repeat protein
MRLVLKILGLVLIPALVGTGVYWERQHLVRDRLAEAQTALGKNSGDAIIDQLLHDYPDNAQVHFLSAQHFRRTKRTGQALECLKQATELGWPQPRINREKLLVLARIDFRRMQRYLQLVLDRSPLDRDVLLLLADGYYNQSKLDKAESLVTRWLNHQPDDREASFIRGQIAMRGHRWELASKDFAAAVAGGPDEYFYSVAAKLLAGAYLELGNFDEALTLFRECHQREPVDTEILYNLGQSASFLQRWDEALDAFQKAIRLRPQRDVLLRAAHVHEVRREFANAIALLKKAESGDPRDLEVISSMARLLQSMGKTEEAKGYRDRYDHMKDYWTEARAGAPGK